MLEGLIPDTRLIIEPKIVDCAISLQFRDGILEKAIIRKGTDCPEIISKVPDEASKLNIKALCQVRVELFYPSENEGSTYSQR